LTGVIKVKQDSGAIRSALIQRTALSRSYYHSPTDTVVVKHFEYLMNGFQKNEDEILDSAEPELKINAAHLKPMNLLSLLALANAG
jgi:hypothetical protein